MGDVNIKNLPETPEINFGDFLLLETPEGTQVIKYDNFIISEKNTTFEPLLSSHSVDIATNTSFFKSLSSNFYTLSGYFENQARVVSDGGDYLYSLSALGLGTSDVAEKLTVLGNISASGSISAIGPDYNYFGSKVGIGTTAPSHHVHIKNSVDNANTYFHAQNTSLGNAGIRLQNSQGSFTIIANERLRFMEGESSEVLTIKSDGKVGIGTTAPHTMLHVGGSGSIAMTESQEHPVTPGANQEAYFYIKADKFIIKFNDAGTIRYKYMVLSGDHVTWVQTLTSP